MSAQLDNCPRCKSAWIDDQADIDFSVARCSACPLMLCENTNLLNKKPNDKAYLKFGSAGFRVMWDLVDDECFMVDPSEPYDPIQIDWLPFDVSNETIGQVMATLANEGVLVN